MTLVEGRWAGYHMDTRPGPAWRMRGGKWIEIVGCAEIERYYLLFRNEDDII